MALADIVERIDSDGQTEAEALLVAARERAEALLAHARVEADRDAAATIAAGERKARVDAETVRANARLAARDRALGAKGALVDEVLQGAANALLALDDERYIALLASRVAASARGGETVRIASADVSRLGAALPPALAALAPGTDLILGESTDRIAHGVELVGERTHVDLSLEAIVVEGRDELALEVAAILFGSGGSV